MPGPGPLVALAGRLAGGRALAGGGRALAGAAGRGGRNVAGRARNPAARKRLGRMRRRRAMRNFARDFLSNMGAETAAGKFDQTSGGGFGGGAAGGGAGEDYDVTLPPMKQPPRKGEERAPSISTLRDQFHDLVKITARIGAITKEQQEELIKQVKNKEKAAQAQKTQPLASPDLPGDQIGEGSSEADRLLAAIAAVEGKLDDFVRDKQQNQGSFFDNFLRNMGAGGSADARARTRRAPQLRRGFRRAGGRYIGPDGRFTTPDKALKNFKQVDPKFLSQAAKGRQATQLARPGIVGRASSRITGTMRTGTRAAAAGAARLAGPALTSKIAQVARPLILKNLAKTGLKSIPILGAGAGLLFAAGRLLQGDVVGAGLEAASGLAGPLTAIPALVATLTRDVYKGTFGVFPEQDPLVGERLGMVKDGVTAIAKSALAGKMEDKKAGGTEDAARTIADKAPEVPDLSAGGQQAGQQTTAPSLSSIPPPPAETTSTQAATPSPPPAPSGGEGGGSGTGGEGATVERSPVEQAPVTGISPGSAPPPELPTTGSGTAVMAASGDGSQITQVAGSTSQTLPQPSTLPTTRSMASGMGNVPEPAYMGAGNLASLLYFGAAAEAMAA